LFPRNIAAARSAQVLVSIHGSGSNNVLFMEEGSAIIEVRPYQFGTYAHEWANAFLPKVGSTLVGVPGAHDFGSSCAIKAA
jgi:capsular polysaccharide biosynthesis protein